MGKSWKKQLSEAEGICSELLPENLRVELDICEFGEEADFYISVISTGEALATIRTYNTTHPDYVVHTVTGSECGSYTEMADAVKEAMEINGLTLNPQ